MYFSRVRIKKGISKSPGLHRLITGSRYSAHKLLWDLFPGSRRRHFIFREEIAGEQLDYRSNAKGEPVYYMVSQEAPSNSILFEVDTKQYSPKLKTGIRLAFKLRANPTVAKKTDGKKRSTRHDVAMDAQRGLLLKLADELGIKREGTKSELRTAVLSKLEGSPQIKTRLSQLVETMEMTTDDLEAPALLDWALTTYADQALADWLMDKGKRGGFNLIPRANSNGIALQAGSYRRHALPEKGSSAGFYSVDFDGVLEVVDPDVLTAALFNGIGPSKAFGCGLMLVRKV
jgi:CRISPR system Cascade subunit CasE